MLLMMLVATAAFAQTGMRVAIGGAIGISKYSDEDFSTKNPNLSFAYRLRVKADSPDGWGWAPKTSVGWSNRKTSTDIGGTRTQLGKLESIPIMGGIERGYRDGPIKVGLSVVGGISVNHFNVDGAARDAYQVRLGETLGDIKVKNAFALRPELSIWYDLGSRFAVQGVTTYLFSHPKAETTIDGVTTTSTWKTDHTSARLGLVVGLF
jgi:hypothetical protein